jgi:hypothetical protein
MKLASTILLIILAGCSDRNPATSFTLSVPPLRPQTQTIESIGQWDGRIVVMTDKYDPKSQRFNRGVHELNTRRGLIVPVCVGKGLKPIAVSENTGECFALCRRGAEVVLLGRAKSDKARWTQRQLPGDIPSGEPLRLAAARDGMFLFSESYLWARSGTNDWRKWELKNLLGKEWKELPRAILAAGNALFIGYDKGEWGGAAYVVPIRSGEVSSPGREIAQFNVCAIEQDVEGKVWIAGGLSHLSMECAWLCVYSNGQMRTLIDQKGVDMQGQRVDVSNDDLLRRDTATEISGLAVSENGKPTLVAARLGVFEASAVKLTPVIKSDFDVSYDEKDYVVGSSPQGISIDRGGNIYVATRSLGVLMFSKAGDGYILKQLTF